MAKHFVLDTNVLLHNPASLFSFADNIVVIPITVIEEMDKFKSESGKNGMHARQVLREIRTRIETALATCAPGCEREAVLAALAEVEREVEGDFAP